jgi:hypothetical protein
MMAAFSGMVGLISAPRLAGDEGIIAHWADGFQCYRGGRVRCIVAPATIGLHQSQICFGPIDLASGHLGAKQAISGQDSSKLSV